MRLLVVAVVAMASGAAATLAWVRSTESNPRSPAADRAFSGPSAPTTPTPSESSSAAGPGPWAPGAESSVARRAAAYERAAQADAASLSTALAELEARPPTLERAVMVEALLLRAAELDPDLALELLAAADLDRRRAASVGFSLLEVFGGGPAEIDRIAAALGDARAFRIEAYGDWARRAPEAALREALAIADESARFAVVQAVAEAWAEVDPAGALAEARSLQGHPAATAFQSAAIATLAEFAPAALAGYLDDGIGTSPMQAGMIISALAQGLQRMDPAEAVALADRLRGPQAQAIKHIALQRWAEDDPAAAVAYAEGLPRGAERRQALSAVARGYGGADPDAALAWVQRLENAPTDLRLGVLAGIAEADPQRALELIFDGGSEATARGPGIVSAVFPLVQSALQSPDIEVADIANRILTLDANASQMAMPMVMDFWAQSEPGRALGWVAQNASRLGARSLGSIVERVARHDPAAAADYALQVAPEHRDAWIGAVARGYAQTDPRGAQAWLAQFRGEPAYSAGIAAVAQHTARFDPAGAAALLRDVDPRDASAASAAQVVASAWTQQDPQAARLWIVGMPEGEVRDGALLAYVGAQSSSPDAVTLSLFSSDRGREQALFAVVRRIATEDPSEARRLINERLTDPDLRRAAEQWVERVESGASSEPGSVSIGIDSGILRSVP